MDFALHSSLTRMKLSIQIVALVFSFLVVAKAGGASELKRQTADAFDRYVSLTESRMASDLAQGRFLWMDGLPEPRQRAVYGRLLSGNIVIERLETRDAGDRIPVPSGLVHHWVAAIFVPGVTLAQTLALLEDYNHHQDIYRPEIVRSTLLKKSDGTFNIYLRLSYKAVVTAVYNANFDVQYTRLGPTRELSRSVSTRIAEIDDQGKPDEHEKPVGKDRGFLWRLYTYGRYEEKGGGTYVQIEFISLSRSVPAIFAWIVNPYLKKIPTEYLADILEATRRALKSAPTAPVLRSR